jgi:excisionase family DNA binding protein
MIDQGMTAPPAGGAATPKPAGAVSGEGGLELLGVADAAKLLGVSEADVQSVLASGDLAGKKIGTTWRIKRSAIDEYLAK